MPDAEIASQDAMTRVIHLLNNAGDVVAIGWEPAASILDRQKALKQTVVVITRVSEMLSMIHTRRIPPAGTYSQATNDILTSAEATALVDAIADLRALMPAAARGCERGMGFPWPPASPRYRESA